MIFPYYPKLHFYTHLWNQNFRKKFLDTKKVSFLMAYFHKLIYISNYTCFLSGKFLTSWGYFCLWFRGVNYINSYNISFMKFIYERKKFLVFDTTLLRNTPSQGALMNLGYQNPTANDRTSKSRKILKSIGLDIL